MKHLLLLYYVVSYSSGLLVLGIASFLYVKERKRIIILYILFQTSLQLLLLPSVIRYYGRITEVPFSPAVDGVLTFINMTGLVMFFLSGPVFFNSIFSKKASRTEKALLLAFNAVTFGGTLFFFVTKNAAVMTYVLQPALYSMLAYLLILGIVCFRTIGHPFLRKSLVAILVVTVIFFPLFIADLLRADMFFALPLYSFIVNMLAVFFSFRFFGEPAFSKGNSTTEYFQKKYSVSKREAEITDCVLEGKSNKEIGECLFISVKTVENHLYSIYQKTGVKNRIQLYNLLKNS